MEKQVKALYNEKGKIAKLDFPDLTNYKYRTHDDGHVVILDSGGYGYCSLRTLLAQVIADCAELIKEA